MFIEILLLFVGQFCAAASIFFIRASHLSPGYLAAYRLFMTILVIAPLAIRDARRWAGEQTDPRASSPQFVLKQWILQGLIPGLILGFHFIFWISGARLTLTANATLFVNMTPIAMPMVIFALTGEKPIWKEIVATLIALSGAVLLSLGDLSLGKDHLIGDLYTLISMVFLTIYLAMSRRNKALPFWFYISSVYFFGGLTAFIFSAVQGISPLEGRGAVELLPVAGLTVFSTLIGHNLINRAMRKIPSQIVGVGQLSQFLWAGLMAWIIFGELPTPIFYPSMVLICIGTLIMVSIHTKSREK